MISRRQFIQAGLVLAALPQQIVLASRRLFNNNFQVPTLETGNRIGKDVYFDLTMQMGKSEIFAGLKTPTLGINQNFLGATLRVNRGDRVHISVKNQMNKTSTLHWHGMKLPAQADGGPHQAIHPGKTWKTEFDIIQPAATLWYHSHQLHKTAEQVYHGLAGMLIIDDKPASVLNLPSEYGVDDLPIIIQDKDFNADGSLRYISHMRDRMRGKKGATVLVNGVINPVFRAQKSLLRLRLLNGSNARTYFLQFDDNRKFHLIGSDGGLLEKTQQTRLIRLAPAERAEILVDIADGKMPILQHKGGQEKFGMGRGMMDGENQDLNIMQIDATQVAGKTPSIPTQLVKHQILDIDKVSRTRFMALQMKMGPMAMMSGDAFSINEKTMDMHRIDEVVKAGSIEIWEISNQSMMAHPFHIHNVQFKIISKSSGNIDGHELGFKDVVLVNPRSSVRVIMQFPQFRDENIPYMYHCHILEHEDGGMMGQFLVV
jgi:bilirubin oxidase